jgi:hypothetical protein
LERRKRKREKGVKFKLQEMLKRKREGSREKIGGDKIKYSKNIE